MVVLRTADQSEEEVDGLDADEGCHEATEAVDQQVLPQEPCRGDPAVADSAQRERDQAQHEWDQAQHERDQAQRNADQVQHERDLAQRVNEKLISTTRQNIVALLGARGVSCSDAFRARIDACSDADFLGEWFTRALHATSEDDVFGTNGTGAASSAPHIEEKR